MSFLQPWMLWAIPLVALPIIIHLLNQWRYQTKRWGAMMFLLAANRMNRGYARLRQWLILAMRALAIAGLIFAVSRPLASGFLGLAGGNKSDATLVLLDRSPSMQEKGNGGQSKLDTGRQQLDRALRTLGGSQWVLIDSHQTEPQTYTTLDGLIDSPSMRGTGATTDVPKMLQGVVDYLNNNKPGSTDVWICSDMRSSDWQPESSHWNVVREAMLSLPQSVRIHLLSYPASTPENLNVRVTEARRESSSEGDAVAISLRVSHAAEDVETSKRSVPVQIEIDGARSELQVELAGREVEIRNHRVPISAQQQKGWGKVSLPADANPADNEAFFVYNQADVRRIVLVSDDRDATRPLEIAAAIAPDGAATAQVDVLTPENLDSLALDNAALVMWQTDLPVSTQAAALMEYVGRGGQVLFFPPTSLVLGANDTSKPFQGVRWSGWVSGNKSSSNVGTNADSDSKSNLTAPSNVDGNDDTKARGALVENWRGDQDLLAVTRSGSGLPVGQLEIRSYATLEGEVSQLATLSGGKPLLARLPTNKGGIYFCTVAPNDQSSTLASNGIVLYAIVQRAIEQGVIALGNATGRTAGQIEESTNDWRMLASAHSEKQDVVPLSNEYGLTAGVYENEGRMFAINRSLVEDQRELVDDKQLTRLFAGLDFSRVDDQAGSLSGIVSEIWRYFLIAMIIALLCEAALCMPRKSTLPATVSGFPQVRTS